MTEPVTTLYADWVERRWRAAEQADHAASLRVLDYLLKRYLGRPAAAKPARFPVSTEVFLNRRAMLVHRYLSFAPKSTVNDVPTAQKRISRVLERMKALKTQESARTPAGGALLGYDELAPTVTQQVGAGVMGFCEYVDEKLRYPRLRIYSDIDAYADNNDFYRVQLMNDDVKVRVLAAKALADSGTLDDVNLFLELLALPQETKPALKPVVTRESTPGPVGSGIGAPVQGIGPDLLAFMEPLSAARKPMSEEEFQKYREYLLERTSDVDYIIRQLKDAAPQHSVPMEEETPVRTEPEPIDERKVLEECAMKIAAREPAA